MKKLLAVLCMSAGLANVAVAAAGPLQPPMTPGRDHTKTCLDPRSPIMRDYLLDDIEDSGGHNVVIKSIEFLHIDVYDNRNEGDPDHNNRVSCLYWLKYQTTNDSDNNKKEQREQSEELKYRFNENVRVSGVRPWEWQIDNHDEETEGWGCLKYVRECFITIH